MTKGLKHAIFMLHTHWKIYLQITYLCKFRYLTSKQPCKICTAFEFVQFIQRRERKKIFQGINILPHEKNISTAAKNLSDSIIQIT